MAQAPASALSQGVWDQIYEAVRSGQSAREVYQGIVSDRDEEDRVVWVQELSSDPIPVVGQSHDLVYYSGTKRLVTKVPPAVPEIGDMVLLAKVMDGRYRCVGIVHPAVEWEAPGRVGLLQPGTVTEPMLAAGVGIPTGVIVPFGGTVAPVAWLLCDAASYLRTDYPALFNVIGTAFGAVDGTHFTVPDKGRVMVGRDSGQVEFDVLGEKGGAKVHTLTIAEMPSHHHLDVGIWLNAQPGALGGNTVAWNSGNQQNVQIVQPTGGGGSHNNLQPYQVVNYIIKT